MMFKHDEITYGKAKYLREEVSVDIEGIFSFIDT